MVQRLVLLIAACVVMGIAYWQFEQRKQRERAAEMPGVQQPAPAAAPHVQDSSSASAGGRIGSK
jgi:uncharacterized membrane protein YebE (DUF533 family)